MKVLWFSNTPSLYDKGTHHYHGGGWIESLEQLLAANSDIELAIAFFHPHDREKIVRGSTTYYPIYRPAGKKKPLRQLVNNWCGRLGNANYGSQFQGVIKDFQPDVIQVFGSEGPFGEIQALTESPVVIHLQGLINPYLNTYFPAGCSGSEFITNPDFLAKTLKGSSPLHARRMFAQQALREKTTLTNSRYVMGRTHWDAMIARLYNPSVSYYHVDEVLRPVFYQPIRKPLGSNTQFQIMSTLSPTVYKGLDVVLRTAGQLRALADFDFQWQIAGIDVSDPLFRHFEKKEGIDHQTVGIKCLGKRSPQELAHLICGSDVFVHPSYIDNSPNSVCEAQILGVPVIACNVGGLSSLIAHKQTGLLVPSNGVFELVHYLSELATDDLQRTRLGEAARVAALERHNRDSIIQRLISSYDDIARKH